MEYTLDAEILSALLLVQTWRLASPPTSPSTPKEQARPHRRSSSPRPPRLRPSATSRLSTTMTTPTPCAIPLYIRQIPHTHTHEHTLSHTHTHTHTHTQTLSLSHTHTHTHADCCVWVALEVNS